MDLNTLDQEFLRKIMKQDAEFLSQKGLMDYSLLINVEKCRQNSIEKSEMRAHQRNFLISQDGNEFYHVGIIDFLQRYDFGKKVENTVRTAKMSPKKAVLISCVEPKKYSKRFFNFCDKHVLGESIEARTHTEETFINNQNQSLLL